MEGKKEEYCIQIEELFSKWWKKSQFYSDDAKKHFYKDGIVDENIWFAENNNFRPLFILKDVNGNSAADCAIVTNFVKDTNDDIQNGIEPTWRRLVTLAEGLYEVYTKEQDVQKYKIIDVDQNGKTRYKNALARIAIMNLKKQEGRESISDKTLRCYICRYRDEILRQIELINPSVIICCGTTIKPICDEFGIFSGFDERVIITQHPSRISIKKFFDETLLNYKRYLGQQEDGNN